jgi:AraC-like DNA-binding protein
VKGWGEVRTALLRYDGQGFVRRAHTGMAGMMAPIQYSTFGLRNSVMGEYRIFQSAGLPFSVAAGVKDRLKIVFIAKGSCSIELKNERAVLAAPALVLLDEKTAVRVLEKENPAVRVVLFHPGFLNSKFDFKNIRKTQNDFSTSERQDIYFLELFLKSGVKPITTLGLHAAAKTQSLLKNMGDILARQERNCWPCDARCCLIELLFFLRTLCDDVEHHAWINQIVFKEPVQGSAALDVNGVLSFLNTHYEEKITVAATAARFHTNRTTLSAAFKQATGLSLVAYVSKIRMQIASSLLRNTVLKVYEIMARVGFNDTSHFLKTFKKHTGHTPARFRKLNTWIKT